MIDYCYHTHTKRCGHAYGEDEEYVVEAIKNGIKEMGFSDHVMLPNHIHHGIRGDFFQLRDYIRSVKYLQEKYKDQIKIYLGFECEYYEEYIDYYKDLLKRQGFDYLILGQHCYIDPRTDTLKWYFTDHYDYESIYKYVQDVCRGMKTHLFKYLAHPDLFITTVEGEVDEKLIKLMHKLCQCAEDTHTPLEINLAGGQWKRQYPCKEFFDIASQYNLEFIFGCDAHRPQEMARVDGEKIHKFMEMYPNLNYINRLKF